MGWRTNRRTKTAFPIDIGELREQTETARQRLAAQGVAESLAAQQRRLREQVRKIDSAQLNDVLQQVEQMSADLDPEIRQQSEIEKLSQLIRERIAEEETAEQRQIRAMASVSSVIKTAPSSEIGSAEREAQNRALAERAMLFVKRVQRSANY